MSDTLKSILFAAALCLGCSLLLTAAATGLRPLQQQNIRVDRQKNVLQSVGLIEHDGKHPAREIDRLYTERIRCLHVGMDGEVMDSPEAATHALPVYLHVGPDGSVENYIVPINTRGLWGKILGYLAIRNDGMTISGFTVYQHSETPGLGGEIEKAWFQRNFTGKKIVNQAGDFVSVAVARGEAAGAPPDKQIHYVDGISGATLTGTYLSKGLHETLVAYEPVSIRFRRDHFRKLPPGEGICE